MICGVTAGIATGIAAEVDVLIATGAVDSGGSDEITSGFDAMTRTSRAGTGVAGGAIVVFKGGVTGIATVDWIGTAGGAATPGVCVAGVTGLAAICGATVVAGTVAA